MSTTAVVTDPSAELARILTEGQLDPELSKAISSAFSGILEEAYKIECVAAALRVTDTDGIVALSEALPAESRRIRKAVATQKHRIKKDAMKLAKCVDKAARLVIDTFYNADALVSNLQEEATRLAQRAWAEKKLAEQIAAVQPDVGRLLSVASQIRHMLDPDDADTRYGQDAFALARLDLDGAAERIENLARRIQ